MVNMLGYLAYVLICATGVIQGTSMILGRNFKYSIWSAVSIEAGLILLQVSLYFSGGAPTYVIVGNAVSVVANGVCLGYMLHPVPEGVDEMEDPWVVNVHIPGDENPGYPPLFIEPDLSSPFLTEVLTQITEHAHEPAGDIDGNPFWEHTPGCPVCEPFTVEASS